MRITLSLPDDVYEAAHGLASYKRVSLGDAVAELVWRGLDQGARMNERIPFPFFDIQPGAHPITLQETLRAEDELGSLT